ncbi:hypothetical protein ACTWP5_32015 [Streptomyces sp. 4N509B]|uniref:hypothetical protein n=1 Tax=Streptomyces sp. 4N509B TaxID=3457413 RepID=UPI003FD47819
MFYGYIWAADEDGAAAFLLPDGSGDDAANAAVSWTLKLRDCKARGLTPMQALAELSAHPGGRRIGRVVPGSQAEAPDLGALKARASGA